MLMALGCGSSFKLHCKPWEGSFSGLGWRQFVPVWWNQLVKSQPVPKIAYLKTAGGGFHSWPRPCRLPGANPASISSWLLLPAQPPAGKSLPLLGGRQETLTALFLVPLSCLVALRTWWLLLGHPPPLAPSWMQLYEEQKDLGTKIP